MDKTQILRKISQIAFFVFFVSLHKFCSICFIGDIETFILKGTISELSALIFIVIIVSTLIFGRVFCGWVCPLGFLFELIYKLRLKLFKTEKLPTVNEDIHKKLIYMRYVVLVTLLFLTFYFSTYAFCDVCPIGYLTYLGGGELALIVLVIAIIASFFIPMVFCRYFCPLGAFLSIFSITPLFQLKLKDDCVKCKLCEFYCPMQIEKINKIDQKECIRCFECKSNCKIDCMSFSSIFKKND